MSIVEDGKQAETGALLETVFAPRDDVDYDLTPEAVARHVSHLEGLQVENSVLTGPRAFYVFSGTDFEADLGRALEREVFAEEFGNTSEVMHKEYNPYEDNSVFFVVVDHDEERVVGVMRLLEGPGEDAFKALNDLQDPERVEQAALRDRDEVVAVHEIDPRTTIELATLAIPKDLRRSRTGIEIQAAMFHATFRYSMEHETQHWVSIIDSHARMVFANMHVPWQPILDGAPFEYLGSDDSLAVIADVSQVEPALRERRADVDSRSIQMIIDGMLDGASAEQISRQRQPA